MQLIPYASNAAQRIWTHGTVQGVFIILDMDQQEQLISKFELWFEARPEVKMVNSGRTDKRYLGCAVLEWQDCAVDPLFIAILRQEPLVHDFVVYTRSLR